MRGDQEVFCECEHPLDEHKWYTGRSGGLIFGECGLCHCNKFCKAYSDPD
jgi:hypothetical protein